MRMKLLVFLLTLSGVFNGTLLAAEQPNILLIFTDDQGYGDLGCFGSENIATPRIDRMAEEGMRFTSFYAQAVCGPSRAALMTGCYPIRVAEPGNRKNQHTIPHPQEITLGEVLQRGYSIDLVAANESQGCPCGPHYRGHWTGSSARNIFRRHVDRG